MTNENPLKLAKHNLEFFHKEKDLVDYEAFLFSELFKTASRTGVILTSTNAVHDEFRLWIRCLTILLELKDLKESLKAARDAGVA